MKIYKKIIVKPCSFLVNGTTLTSDNSLRFTKNILEKIYNKSKQLIIRLQMKNYNVILAEKQQKYQPYCHVKFINMNILLAKKYYLQVPVK